MCGPLLPCHVWRHFLSSMKPLSSNRNARQWMTEIFSSCCWFVIFHMVKHSLQILQNTSENMVKTPCIASSFFGAKIKLTNYEFLKTSLAQNFMKGSKRKLSQWVDSLDQIVGSRWFYCKWRRHFHQSLRLLSGQDKQYRPRHWWWRGESSRQFLGWHCAAADGQTNLHSPAQCRVH